MAQFNRWKHLITNSSNLVNVRISYKLEEAAFGIRVLVSDTDAGWVENLGIYPTIHDAVNALDSYKDKVQKLARYEEELF